MLCSVVVPVYNKGRYVRRAIESVLAQTHRNLELIVIDDGSTDDSRAVVESMSDPRIRLESQSNGGVSLARNRGIELSRGELVTFLDADDWYHPEFIAHLIAAGRRHPDVDVVATGFAFVRDAEAGNLATWPIDPSPTIEVIHDLHAWWLSAASLCTNSIGVRKSLLDRLPTCFPPGESLGEDLDLWFRLNEYSAVAFVAVPLVAYRIDVEGSLSTSHPARDLLPVWRRMERRALDGVTPHALRRSALRLVAHQRVTLARAALSEGRRAEALAWLLSGRRALHTRRWWISLVLVGIAPSVTAARAVNWLTARQSRQAMQRLTVQSAGPEQRP